LENTSQFVSRLTCVKITTLNQEAIRSTISVLLVAGNESLFSKGSTIVSAVRTSLSAGEFFGHSHAWPGLWLLASSGFFFVSRTARRNRSRASLGGIFSSVQRCFSVTISIADLVAGFSTIKFISHLDCLMITHKTRNTDMSGAIFGMKIAG